ncbi:MAG: fibronectin type III domain-containing protein [Acidobacteriota bacterium]
MNGTIPPELGNLSRLFYLILDRNQLSGTIPPNLGTLEYLTNLSLYMNQLGGSIPSELGNLTTLNQLKLHNNQLTGSLPPELGNLSALRYDLDLSFNQLTGALPAELGDLSFLQRLNLSFNNLSGVIPVEFGNLSSMQWLDLSNNQLSGSLPPSLGNMSLLQRMILHTNQLTGSIPSELGNLASLLYLHLNSNQLSGSIPPELENLSSLQWLFLDFNQLSGSLPPELGNLPNVYLLTLNSNKLSGEIPLELQNLPLLDVNGLDLQLNALHTDNAALIAFLDAKHMFGVDWQITQTIAPANLAVGAVGDHTVWLSWDAVDYQADPGGYSVYSAPMGSGVWTPRGWTEAKTETTFPVTGLDPATNYDLAVVTYTDPHLNNFNLVSSEFTPLEMTTTASTGCGQPNIEVQGVPPITLSLSESYDSYLWSTGETTSSITVNPVFEQWYWVTVSSAGPCEETAATSVVPVTDIFADGFESGDVSAWTSSQ